MKPLIFITLILALFSGVFFLADHKKRTRSSTPAPSFQALQKKWKGTFAHGDAKKAYQEFVDAGAMMSYDNAHTLSHVIGEILYAQYGFGGLEKCGPDFSYGCYHGFAGRALSEHGVSSVADLDADCMKSADPLGCEHGIGHGILAFLGNEKLSQALTICGSLHQASPIAGCFGGVFMEYNFNTMQSKQGIEVRPYVPAQAYEPCATVVPSEYRAACYFDQPAWWRAAAASSSSSDAGFSATGALCAKIAGSEDRDMCYRGVGNIVAPESAYDETMMRTRCATMPDAHARAICFTEAKQHRGK